MTRVLVAGAGNIFHGDDAFGVEVARRLSNCELPGDVAVVDFGIRGIDLTYALLDGYEAAVLVDAAQRGEAPGTLSVIEPEAQELGESTPEDLILSPHELEPAKALRLAASLGATCRRFVVVACEPLTLGGVDGAMGLSEPVAAAVDPAIRLIRDLLGELARETSRSGQQQEPAAPRAGEQGEAS